MNKLSQFFYRCSNFYLAISITLVWQFFLYFVFIDKALEFQVPNANVQSLGTAFGFDETKISDFLTSRSEEKIKYYIELLQIWDMIFALIYGIIFMVWLSFLLKHHQSGLGRLNLFPLNQVFFDFMENIELSVICNQYLLDGTFSSGSAQRASIYCMIKWTCYAFTIGLIVIGLILFIFRIAGKKALG